MCEAEKVSYSPDGLEAIIFTAEGDMRNALNNLQATHSGFGHVDQVNVFKVRRGSRYVPYLVSRSVLEEPRPNHGLLQTFSCLLDTGLVASWPAAPPGR